MADKLQGEIAKLENAKSFLEVHEIIKLNKISGFGELSIYDTAVRISAYLGYKPEKVYLHAGARKGAEYLGVKGLIPRFLCEKDTLSVNIFPESVQTLEALQIENFLCSYKDDINKL